MIKSLVIPFFFGLGGPVASGKQYLPWIHLEDHVNLVKYAIENDSVHGVLNGVAPDIVTNAEFSKVKNLLKGFQIRNNLTLLFLDLCQFI